MRQLVVKAAVETLRNGRCLPIVRLSCGHWLRVVGYEPERIGFRAWCSTCEDFPGTYPAEPFVRRTRED